MRLRQSFALSLYHRMYQFSSAAYLISYFSWHFSPWYVRDICLDRDKSPYFWFRDAIGTISQYLIGNWYLSVSVGSTGRKKEKKKRVSSVLLFSSSVHVRHKFHLGFARRRTNQRNERKRQRNEVRRYARKSKLYRALCSSSVWNE